MVSRSGSHTGNDSGSKKMQESAQTAGNVICNVSEESISQPTAVSILFFWCASAYRAYRGVFVSAQYSNIVSGLTAFFESTLRMSRDTELLHSLPTCPTKLLILVCAVWISRFSFVSFVFQVFWYLLRSVIQSVFIGCIAYFVLSKHLQD